MTYKILVVGSGNHALAHWRQYLNIHEAFEVSGVVDTDPEVLEKANEFWGVEDDAIATTVDEAVEFGIPADIALICTPIESHHGIAIEAMRNGLHVICEKNMARTMQAGLEMTRCAIEHPRLATVVGHQYPYWRKSNWAMRKAIGEGSLGQLASIECSFNNDSWNPSSPTRSGWRRFLDHDYLEDWAVHTLDLFRYFTAMDAIVVTADLWRPAWSARYGTSSINVRMLLASADEYEGNETLAWAPETDKAKRLWKNGKIPDSWVRGQYTGHSEAMGEFEHGEHWRIFGSKGSLEFMDGGHSKNTSLRMVTHDGDPESWHHDAGGLPGALGWSESNLEPYPVDLECGPAAQWTGDNTEEEWDNNAFILEEIKQCIESGGKVKPLRCFESTIKTFAITMAAIDSARSGGAPVFLPDLWEISRD